MDTLSFLRNIQKHLPVKYHSIATTYIINYGEFFASRPIKQTGGTDSFSIIKTYHYDNKKYSFNVQISDETSYILLSVLSTNGLECITVLIDKSNRTAVIQNMSYHGTCAIEGLPHPSGGTILFEFILKLLKKKKESFQIDRIILTDNSYLPCECPHTIKLSRLRQVTKFNTWYGKYGFVPIENPNLVKINNKILEKLLVSQVPIKKYILEGLVNNSIKNYQYDEAEIDKLLVQHPSFRDFIMRLSNELPKYCCVIEYILKEVFNSNKPNRIILADPFHKTYELKNI